jgi:hypothetical protein
VISVMADSTVMSAMPTYHRCGDHDAGHAGTTLRSALNLINIDERRRAVNRNGVTTRLKPPARGSRVSDC